ncbi:uncharacterized protein [Nicotiana sylvestris]|uniref:uncharacterized protein n=1 Tax=Nicotiana sylvestris TaxID=4096 RepID=UPI00388C867D
MMKKDAATSWTREFQKAFDKIKEYLSKPPILVQPEPGRPLLLYLSVLDGDFGCVLEQYDETGRKDHAIYYLRADTLLVCIHRIPHIKDESAEIHLSETHAYGKVSKILLSEFDIIYVTQKAIKGKALADHLAENPVDGEYEPLKMYFPDEVVSFVGEDITKAYDSFKMFFDRAANFKGIELSCLKNFLEGIKDLTGLSLISYNIIPYQDFIFSLVLSSISQESRESIYILYYWSFGMRYKKIHADMIRVPPNGLNETSAPCPFSAWGVDVIGPIEPAGSNGHRFILMAIDYFTKWVEVASYEVVTKKVITNCVQDHIVCRFGVPELIITDNAANLNSDLMKAMCETFNIKN